MSIDVALTHRTSYRYDKAVRIFPQIVRLRPAPHSRTRILSYSQKISPADHFINWQQDAFANYQARLVFPERADHFEVKIDLVARMVAINPFDFFLEDDAQEVPFAYDRELAADLAPYLRKDKLGPRFAEFIAAAPKQTGTTNDWVVALNQYVQNAVGYIVRMEPGVQTPEETLTRGKGSCRDSGWLLVRMLRELGYAARFVSGYLIQLTADLKAVGGPSGPEADFTDLHAWCEVYLPGAGWVGLDPTSGLFAGEGHIPLAATPEPKSAAPISGGVEPCEVEFDFDMKVTRLRETPRVTKPVTDEQWAEIRRIGARLDQRMAVSDVRLTMGGEPTFVAEADRDAGEWTVDAVGPTKRAYADRLIRRLRDRFAPGGVLHYGQGKWYPGEQLPRWAFELHWRSDGWPLWEEPALIAPEGRPTPAAADAERFISGLCKALDVDPVHAQAVFEDPAEFLLRERKLAPNVDPLDSRIDDPQERERLARVFDRGLSTPAAFVLPLQLAQARAAGPRRKFRWVSDKWATRRGRLFLIPGDSPAGFRLPLKALTHVPEAAIRQPRLRDPFAARRQLPRRGEEPPAPLRMQTPGGAPAAAPLPPHEDWLEVPDLPEGDYLPLEEGVEGFAEIPPGAGVAPGYAIRTALTVEPREGALCVFLPPVGSADEYADLVAAIEETAETTGIPVRVEGYPPPSDPRLNVIKVTPDPGVIEVNIHPADSFAQQAAITEALYEEARQIGLDSSTFQIDGRPTGSGGGNHIVLGGNGPENSPFLRRPDLLASIIRYWQRHPSLSYLFSGMFIGPTSQAPRFDEGRPESVYEMEIALAQLPEPGQPTPPWLVDRIFRHLLIDVTGNTHRAEICIDKLYSPDGPTGRLGLVEFRGFEMPPHPRMALAQALLIRALIAWFWEAPYRKPLVRWGARLHDRFLLPHHAWADFNEVLSDLSEALGQHFDAAWFAAQFEFRFPLAGRVEVAGATVELRSAIEPWNVLGEEGTVGGTARFVDSSVERIQVRATDLGDNILTCNGVELPLDRDGVAGVRFRAWRPPSCLHPTIGEHGPLVFDVISPRIGRSLGGCVYHVHHPGGRSHETRPINALEAEGRRLARFDIGGHTPGPVRLRPAPPNPDCPHTLDLRRVAP